VGTAMTWNGIDISNDTGRMLDELIKRKEKLKKAERDVVFYCVFSVTCSVMFFISFQTLISPLIKSPLDILSLTIGNYFVFGLLLGSVVSYLQTTNVLRKVKELKTKYEVLRKEAILHLQTTWAATPKSQIRDSITEYMTLKGINVNYVGK
jgi:hypothetical protein